MKATRLRQFAAISLISGILSVSAHAKTVCTAKINENFEEKELIVLTQTGQFHQGKIGKYSILAAVRKGIGQSEISEIDITITLAEAHTHVGHISASMRRSSSDDEFPHYSGGIEIWEQTASTQPSSDADRLGVSENASINVWCYKLETYDANAYIKRRLRGLIPDEDLE